jgi:hypothetical protein
MPSANTLGSMSSATSLEMDHIWRRIQAELRLALDESSFRIWLEPLRLVDFAAGNLVVEAPRNAHRWIEDRFGGVIQASVELVLGPSAHVELISSEEPDPFVYGQSVTMSDRAPRAANQSARVFVSYVTEDLEEVWRLCSELKHHGVAVWLDSEQLRPGDRWRDVINEAIRTGAFFLACFSSRSEAKERSYMREEVALAIKELGLRATDRAWFIPVLLSPCTLPDREIGPDERLADLQYADLTRDWTAGVLRLATALTGPGVS